MERTDVRLWRDCRSQAKHPARTGAGIGIVGLLYVFVNTSYFFVLPPTVIASLGASSATATAAAATFLGEYAGRLMAAVLAMSIASALVVANLVSARIPYAMAVDGLFFRSLAHVSVRTRVPIRALIAQSAWTIILVLSGSFDALTDYTIFAILAFSTMLGASLFLHRIRRPDAERAYRTFGYPVVPALFLLVTVWLVINTLMTAPGQALAGLGLIALGVPFYWYWSRKAGPRSHVGRNFSCAVVGRTEVRPYLRNRHSSIRSARAELQLGHYPARPS